MSTREDFEAWAIDADYSVHKNKLGLYTMQRTKRAWDAYQAATSLQEAKIKALVEALELLDALCPALIGDKCDCSASQATVDKTWAQFCAGIGDGPKAPYPGMIAAFEAHYAQSFADKDWRSETGVWAAAWKAAKAQQEQPACKYCNDRGELPGEYPNDVVPCRYCSEADVQQGQVTDQENEKFSMDVSNFKGADPEATRYALEQFLRNRAKEQPAQEPVAYELEAVKFANGKQLVYQKPENLASYIKVRTLVYADTAPTQPALSAELKAAVERTRFDLLPGGSNYPDVRTLLAFAEAAIEAHFRGGAK